MGGCIKGQVKTVNDVKRNLRRQATKTTSVAVGRQKGQVLASTLTYSRKKTNKAKC
jgi:hypothetical protein